MYSYKHFYSKSTSLQKSYKTLSTQAGHNLCKTGPFWGQFYVTLSCGSAREVFKDQEGSHSLLHLPETYGFHPPRTEILQLRLNLDWTAAGQGSQLQPQHQVSKQSFTKKGGAGGLQIKLRMCRIQTVSSEHTSLIIAFLNNKHVDGCSPTEERVT